VVAKAQPAPEEEAKPAEGETATAAPIVKPPGRIKRFFRAVGAYFLSRSPSKGGIIFVSIGFAILMSLGTWQVMRLHEKNATLVDVRQKLEGPLSVHTKLWPQSADEWRDMAYKPIIIKGVWLSLHRFKLMPRTYEGQVGYQLMQPMRLPDRQVVLVNRGFIPEGQAILPPLENQEAIIQGIPYVPPAKKPWQTPENLPSRGRWTWIDMTALQHEIGIDEMAPVVLYETRNPDSSDYPIGGQLPLPTQNRHAQYAMTWYMLALLLLVIAFLASGQKKEKALAGDGTNKIADPVAERGMYPEATD
jgi:surfeit locus 1 family protein